MYVTLTKELRYLASVAVRGDPEHRGVCVGGDGDRTGCLEVKEGMSQSLGKIALSRERAAPTNTPTTRTWSWLAVCSHAGGGRQPYTQRAEVRGCNCDRGYSSRQSKGNGGGGWSERGKVIPNERSERLHNKAGCTQGLGAVQEFIQALSQR